MSDVDIRFPRAEALSGIGWELTGGVLGKVLKFLTGIILARLLMPEDFGLLALAVICFGFTELFLELGMVTALVQREELQERHRSSAFWLTFLAGVGLALLVFVFSPLLSEFFRESRLQLILMVMAVDLAVSGAHVVHRAMIRRTMQFDKKVQIQLISVVGAGSVAVTMAAAGWGVWSLVANYMLLTLFDAIGYWTVSAWIPRFTFGRDSIRELFEVGGGVTGFKVLNFWVGKLDDLLIGRYQGSDILGIYTRAYSLMTMPARELTFAVGRVMMPALSKIQDDREQFKAIYLRVNRLIGLISIPAVAGLILTAHSFVVGVLGPHWEAAVPFLQLLCLEGLKKPIQSTAGWVFEATGETWLQFRWGLVRGACMIGGICVGIFWGAWGVAVAFVIVNYLLWYPHIRIVGGLIDMTFGEHLANLNGIILGTAFMAAGVLLVDIYLVASWSPWPRLLTKSGLGIVIYGSFVHGFDVRPYRDAREFVIERFLCDSKEKSE